MAAPKFLSISLKLMALYAGIMATFTLFFQEAGMFIFRYRINDPMVTRYWGGVLLAMAMFYLFVSTDPEKYRLLLWVGVFDLGTAMVLSIYHMSIETISIVQGLIGIVVNPIFMVVLLYGLAHKQEGEVVLVSGRPPEEGGHHLPDHIVGHHPLHRK